MNLHSSPQADAEANQPIRVGKLGTTLLSQILLTSGMDVLGIAELDVNKSYANLEATGWPHHRYQAQLGFF